MSGSRSQGKPFEIPKQMVWEAYQRVKANKGAAGVDGQSVEQFEQDLRNNLYRLWNRMSSGSYFPPPARLSQFCGWRDGVITSRSAALRRERGSRRFPARACR